MAARKLSDDAVYDIALNATPKTYRKFSETYGVEIETVRRIVTGKANYLMHSSVIRARKEKIRMKELDDAETDRIG